MSISIENKVVLVTGANRGIGKAIVEAFINHGAAKVYAAVRNVESADPLVATFGDKIVPIQIDLADEASIITAAKTAKDVEILVNNAGVAGNSSIFDDKALETMAFELDINLYGLVRIARAFSPVLKSNGGGAFVQLNSVASMKTFPSLATYCASKAASYAITQALRETLAEQGTLVVSVHPGPINTDILIGTGFEEIAEPPELVADGIIEALKNDEFHLFPDTLAKQIGSAYQGFAENVILAEQTEG